MLNKIILATGLLVADVICLGNMTFFWCTSKNLSCNCYHLCFCTSAYIRLAFWTFYLKLDAYIQHFWLKFDIKIRDINLTLNTTGVSPNQMMQRVSIIMSKWDLRATAEKKILSEWWFKCWSVVWLQMTQIVWITLMVLFCPFGASDVQNRLWMNGKYQLGDLKNTCVKKVSHWLGMRWINEKKIHFWVNDYGR